MYACVFISFFLFISVAFYSSFGIKAAPVPNSYGAFKTTQFPSSTNQTLFLWSIGITWATFSFAFVKTNKAESKGKMILLVLVLIFYSSNDFCNNKAAANKNNSF